MPTGDLQACELCSVLKKALSMKFFITRMDRQVGQSIAEGFELTLVIFHTAGNCKMASENVLMLSAQNCNMS